MNRIVINLTDTIWFQIVMTHHDMKSPVYMDKVNRFKQGIASIENLFHDLDLPTETEQPIDMHTPGTGEIHLRKQLD